MRRASAGQWAQRKGPVRSVATAVLVLCTLATLWLQQRQLAIRRTLDQVKLFSHEILASLEYLEACESSCEPNKLLAACPQCNRHDRATEVPDLVLGFRS